ncbi:hypothetical protein [Methylovirgula sp. 4M-Z18]|uniref:hypothetical protein n=1 Tax=Methylovirgula sp. 4M-Z18 TaxID=2293567 RepID=UPI000E2FA1F2|nr:hypothetical protein [Methylovirgula sp. 4M-Z18]RFB78031.1 hypothetical protein DYH55_18665 [Methylovirgula sp. 4M-Z18]
MNDLLLFKLTVTPLLLLAASLASRRWGEAIGGFLVGLPLTSGPISVFLALEHGIDFAARATAGSLAATAAQACFCIVYCRMAARGWPTALATACFAFALVSGALQWAGVSRLWLFLLSIAGLFLALALIPRSFVRAERVGSPWWDLPARMVLITFLVVGVTLIAPYVGPQMSGILASIPFMAIILTVFAHRMLGDLAAAQVMRGMAAALFGFAVFFYVLSLMLTQFSLPVTYVTAVLSALAVQGVSLLRMHQPTTQPAE